MTTGTSNTKTDAAEALKQLTYLAAALKAPRITEACPRRRLDPRGVPRRGARP
jgi:hypothetical protein